MRRRLIDAAITVLVKRGYSGFRVAEVGKAARVSRGGQLHHFRTKDSMVLAALEELYRRSDRASENNLARTGSNVLTALAEDSRQFFYGTNFLASVDVLMSAAKQPALARKVRTIPHRHRLRVEEMWAQRLSSERVSLGAARDAVWLVHAVYRGLVFRKQVAHSVEQARRVEKLIVQLVAEYLEPSR